MGGVTGLPSRLEESFHYLRVSIRHSPMKCGFAVSPLLVNICPSVEQQLDDVPVPTTGSQHESI